MPSVLQPAPARPPNAVQTRTRQATGGDELAKSRGSPGLPQDRDRGLSLLYLFIAATAVMVGCVLLAGAVDSWWILIVTTALLGVTTFAVFAGIVRLMADEGIDDDR